MTRSDKPTTRLTYATHQGREIIATIHKSYLQMRLKGTQQMATLDIEAAPFLQLFAGLIYFFLVLTEGLMYYRAMKTTEKRQHVCDTNDPQRPCCWMARRAEMKALKATEQQRLSAQAEHDAKVDGFITRGLD